MRPRTLFPPGTQEMLEKLLKETTTASETKRIQCILLRVRDDADNASISRITGYTEDSIKNIHSRFLRLGESCLLEKPK